MVRKIWRRRSVRSGYVFVGGRWRNYVKEARWAASRKQKKRRAERNAARRKAMREGRVRKGDGKHVHHVGAKRSGSLKRYRTKVMSARKNRSIQPKRR